MQKESIELIPPSTIIANGTQAHNIVQLGTATMCVVRIEVAQVVGSPTSPQVVFWLEWSFQDERSDWATMPHDLSLELDDTSQTQITAIEKKRNIGKDAVITAAGVWTALYRHVPAGRVRLKSLTTGTFGAGEGFDTRAHMDVAA